MLKLYFILFLASTCIASKEDNINELGADKFSDDRATTPPPNGTRSNDTSDELDENYTVPWNTYIALLMKVSIEQLENVKSNTKKYYKLADTELNAVDEAFNGSGIAYEQMLQHNLKMIIENKRFNSTHSFMMDFTDLSNYLLEQIIEYNLGRVNGKLLLPTKWYKQIMRQKILRQQAKISTNFVETYMCNELSVCKDRWYYTEYLVEWLRHLLNVNSYNLKAMFNAIPDILERNMHTVKTNLKFKKTVKYIVSANDVVQRDTIDYLDEVITNQKNVFNIVPEILKKGAIILVDLFKVLDDNYDLNEENEEQLEKISELLTDWIQNDSGDVTGVLEAILQNMQLNLKIWPLDVQRKVDLIWSKITTL